MRVDNIGSFEAYNCFLYLKIQFFYLFGKKDSLKTTARVKDTRPVGGCKQLHPLCWELYPINTHGYVFG